MLCCVVLCCVVLRFVVLCCVVLLVRRLGVSYRAGSHSRVVPSDSEGVRSAAEGVLLVGGRHGDGGGEEEEREGASA